MKKDIPVYIALGLGAFLIVCLFAEKILVEKIADRVIIKLKQDYSPSPYGPSFDADKIDMEKINFIKENSTNAILYDDDVEWQNIK